MTLSFEQARACVLREVSAARPAPSSELLPVLEAVRRVVAEDVIADRDYPPFARAVRDGFAVRSTDLPGELRVIGEVRAGETFPGEVATGEAVEIMTGAPLPRGADAVVMVEHTVRSADRVKIDRKLTAGENFTPLGAEARSNSVVLRRGRCLSFPQIALLAMIGREHVNVFRRPTIGIIPTGDELVEVTEQPLTFQIRNSNAWSLAVQVARAGGEPKLLGIARDNYESTRGLVEKGLECDLLLLSGGVSAGKYDIVEKVLGDLGAQFYFDRVAIQPGQPLVFGSARGKFFFGLPGNPASTMVTFEVFARAALELLCGVTEAPLRFLRARLATEFRQKTGLTRFLPAQLSVDGSSVTPEPWGGSGDVPSIARANAFLVTDPDRESWAAGDDIRVLMI